MQKEYANTWRDALWTWLSGEGTGSVSSGDDRLLRGKLLVIQEMRQRRTFDRNFFDDAI